MSLSISQHFLAKIYVKKILIRFSMENSGYQNDEHLQAIGWVSW